MSIHFISDLHLDDAKPGIKSILLNYLENRACTARQLYLLGDIFEYWLGDDVSLSRHADVCADLRRLSDAGTDVFFMHGNRDFLVGETFAEQSGATLLKDPHLIHLNDQPVLLSHGDLFCTDDVEHQKFRELVSQQDVKDRLLSLPAGQREQMAQQLRSMSKSNTGAEAMDIMDVNQVSVESQMRKHGVKCLIHGHTHRPAMHEFDLDGEPARRIVLSDWREDCGSVLIAEDGDLRFEELG